MCSRQRTHVSRPVGDAQGQRAGRAPARDRFPLRNLHSCCQPTPCFAAGPDALRSRGHLREGRSPHSLHNSDRESSSLWHVDSFAKELLAFPGNPLSGGRKFQGDDSQPRLWLRSHLYAVQGKLHQRECSRPAHADTSCRITEEPAARSTRHPARGTTSHSVQAVAMSRRDVAVTFSTPGRIRTERIPPFSRFRRRTGELALPAGVRQTDRELSRTPALGRGEGLHVSQTQQHTARPRVRRADPSWCPSLDIRPAIRWIDWSGWFTLNRWPMIPAARRILGCDTRRRHWRLFCPTNPGATAKGRVTVSPRRCHRDRRAA